MPAPPNCNISSVARLSAATASVPTFSRLNNWKISKKKNKAKIGNVYKVLFEGLSQESDLLFQGRMEGQAQEIDGYILINDMPEDLDPRIGEIYNVRINEAFDYDLIGEIV